MAATAILRSQDYLQPRFGCDAVFLTPSTSSVTSQRKRNPNPRPRSPIPNPNSHILMSRRRKRSPVAVHANQNDRDRSRFANRLTEARNPSSSNLVMGQVKILKRGEKLSPENRNSQVVDVSVSVSPKISKKNEGFEDSVLGSTDRFGPDPEMFSNQIRVSDLKNGVYAGFAVVESPPPSSVPFPAAFVHKSDVATNSLKRLLRLD